MNAIHVDCLRGHGEVHVTIGTHESESIFMCQWTQTHATLPANGHSLSIHFHKLSIRWMDVIHAVSFITMNTSHTFSIHPSLVLCGIHLIRL